MSIRTRLVVTAVATALVGSTASLALAAPAPDQPAPAAEHADGRVLVKYRRDVDQAAAAALERSAGAKRVGEVPQLGVQVLSVPPGAQARVVAALSRSGKVEYAERDAVVRADAVTPDDTYWAKQWGLRKVGAPVAWETTTGSSRIVIAVIDSGVNSQLVEFRGRVLPGRNFLTGSTQVDDDNGHGTAAAGVALAAGNNAEGVAGTCWSCQLLPAKVLDANGTGTVSAVAEAVTWAADAGADVLSISLGSSTPSPSLDSAVAYARQQGAVVVASAGNNSCDCPQYPAASPGVLAVAATDMYDGLYSYSNRGAWVDLAAPGQNQSVSPSGTYYPFGGTSSAGPVVAGAAALLRSAGFGAAETEQRLTSTAVAVGAAVQHGRLDVAAALAAGAPPPAPTTSTSPSPSPSPSSEPTPSASPSASAGPTTTPGETTSTFSGSGPKKGAVQYALQTSGGTVTVEVQQAAAALGLSVVGSDGRTLASTSGGSGTRLTATVAPGAFDVVVTAPHRVAYTISVTRPV